MRTLAVTLKHKLTFYRKCILTIGTISVNLDIKDYV